MTINKSTILGAAIAAALSAKGISYTTKKTKYPNGDRFFGVGHDEI
jgi:hypothetical protein